MLESSAFADRNEPEKSLDKKDDAGATPRKPTPLPMFEGLMAKANQEKAKEDAEDDDEDDEDDTPSTVSVAAKAEQVDEADSAESETGSILEAAIFDRQATNLHSEGVIHQELPESTSTTSDERAGPASEWEPSPSLSSDEGREYIRPVPEDQESEAALFSSSTGGSGGAPPKPPTGPAAGFGFSNSPNQNPRYDQSPDSLASSWNAGPTPELAPERPALAAPTETVVLTEKDKERRGWVAPFVLGYALHAFLTNRKNNRYKRATEKQMHTQNEHITQLQSEQHQLRQKVSSQAEAFKQHPRAEQVKTNQPKFEQPSKLPTVETLPPIKSLEQEQLFDQEGNKIVLQPGWHVERSAGGYSEVVDKDGRVVREAIPRGEAYLRDQKPEQVKDDLFAIPSSSAQADDAANAALPPMIESGQADFAHELRPGTPTQVDLEHRLQGPHNQVIRAVASPWLWTAIAMLFIIYFIAALA